MLNDFVPDGGGCVIYWMQNAQRTRWNHALEYALKAANSRKLPLYVFFCLVPDYPGANVRHFSFMLEGLKETFEELASRGIGHVIRTGDPPAELLMLTEELRPAVLVFDCGHLRVQRQWRKRVAERVDCRVLEVETDMVVPVWTASDRLEPAAWTLRKKLQPHLEWFLRPVSEIDPAVDSTSVPVHSEELTDERMDSLKVDRSVKPSKRFAGGASEAERLWKDFLKNKLHDYARKAREPGSEGTSLMSPYLHFGQVSPLKLALEAGEAGNAEEFLEQLIVRRELAINLAWYHPRYDGYGAAPEWAMRTLEEHLADRREALYSLKELETASTGDEYWNAAQREMVRTGHMHGYMRMYWGKKVLQWTENPAAAHRCLVYLNDRYQLDGRDANGYAGIAWCFGRHDRPFGTFPVTGNLRRLGTGLEKMRKQRSSRYNGYLRRISGNV